MGKRKHNLVLSMFILTIVIWGSGFVLTKIMFQHGFEKIPSAVNAIRFATAFLICSLAFIKHIKLDKQVWTNGIFCGACLFLGFYLQLTGLQYTTASNCGFFSTAYVIFAPIISLIAFKKKPTWNAWLGIALSITGLFILNLATASDEVAVDVFKGNVYTVLSSLAFAVQISLCDKALEKTNAYTLNFVQLLTASLLFTAYFVIKVFAVDHYTVQVFATIDWKDIWWCLAIVSVGGTAFAYISQTLAQYELSPAETSLIMAGESIVSAVLAVLFIDEQLTWNLVVGGTIVVASILIAELIHPKGNSK